MSEHGSKCREVLMAEVLTDENAKYGNLKICIGCSFRKEFLRFGVLNKSRGNIIPYFNYPGPDWHFKPFPGCCFDRFPFPGGNY